MSSVPLCPKNFGQIIVSPQFSYCTPSHYLAERRILAPFDRDIPIPGRYGEILRRSWVSRSKTRVDLTRVSAVNVPYQGLLVQTYIRCHGSRGKRPLWNVSINRPCRAPVLEVSVWTPTPSPKDKVCNISEASGTNNEPVGAIPHQPMCVKCSTASILCTKARENIV